MSFGNINGMFSLMQQNSFRSNKDIHRRLSTQTKNEIKESLLEYDIEEK
jgi:hypothetical protein